MTEEYTVGVVGCGGMGHSHAESYREHDRTTVVAAADMDEGARAAFAEEFGAETFEDHSALLAGADVDVVSVCTWHSTHAEIVVDACEAGVAGVLCEKPMATSLGEAEDMLDAAERNGTKLTVSHQRRFDPVHETARELVAAGAVGEPRSVTGRQSGGLLNWGTHVIDMARYLLGDPDYEWAMGQVERRSDRHERALAVEDRCVGHLCFDSGTRMTYESDMPDPDFDGPMIQVSGTEGVLNLDLGSSVTVTNADGTSEHAPEGERDNRARYLDEFVAWLDGDREGHRCDGAAGVAVMESMMALYESARTRGVVEAPLETRSNPLLVMIEDGDLPVEQPGAYDIRLPYASVRRE